MAQGAPLGAALGVLVDVVGVLSGHPLPPGTGAAVGGALATLCAYFAPGGRKGEGD